MLRYNATTIGTIKVKQELNNLSHTMTLQIRQGNCLAVVIWERKATAEENAENPKAKYFHELYTFYADEQHLKNILKNEGQVLFDKVLSIKLNMYFKECSTLLKYFVRSGYKVTCYYEPIKEK